MKSAQDPTKRGTRSRSRSGACVGEVKGICDAFARLMHEALDAIGIGDSEVWQLRPKQGGNGPANDRFTNTAFATTSTLAGSEFGPPAWCSHKTTSLSISG